MDIKAWSKDNPLPTGVISSLVAVLITEICSWVVSQKVTAMSEMIPAIVVLFVSSVTYWLIHKSLLGDLAKSRLNEAALAVSLKLKDVEITSLVSQRETMVQEKNAAVGEYRQSILKQAEDFTTLSKERDNALRILKDIKEELEQLRKNIGPGYYAGPMPETLELPPGQLPDGSQQP